LFEVISSSFASRKRRRHPYYSLASASERQIRSEATSQKQARRGVKKYLNERGFAILAASTRGGEANANPTQVALAWCSSARHYRADSSAPPA